MAGQSIQCPGCSLPVDVTAPPDVKYTIHYGTDGDGARTVEIHVGSARVHRCIQCRDGMWR